MNLTTSHSANDCPVASPTRVRSARPSTLTSSPIPYLPGSKRLSGCEPRRIGPPHTRPRSQYHRAGWGGRRSGRRDGRVRRARAPPRSRRGCSAATAANATPIPDSPPSLSGCTSSSAVATPPTRPSSPKANGMSRSRASSSSRAIAGVSFCPLCSAASAARNITRVRSALDPASGLLVYIPRALNDLQNEDGAEAGFLHVDTTSPWPTDPIDVVDHFPTTGLRSTTGCRGSGPSRRKDLPPPGPRRRERP